MEVHRPETRYGRARLDRRSRRRIAIALGVLALAAGVCVAVIGYLRLGTSDVKGELSGYRVIDRETVDVIMGVTRSDPSQPVVCIVRARSADGSETGRREVLVGPSEHTTVQITAQVKTSRPPVNGDVYGCGAEVPSYLVPPG
ncbi:MAG TPA: DUF4307 domain-containing protein [Mycobacterium sp.]|nr:DUF4307 domain-containing protein [Mycobacterium sp.]